MLTHPYPHLVLQLLLEGTGSERWRASPKLHSTLDVPSPAGLALPMHPCKSKIRLMALLSLSCYIRRRPQECLALGRLLVSIREQKESPYIQIFLVEKCPPPPILFLMGGTVAYQGPGRVLRVWLT